MQISRTSLYPLRQQPHRRAPAFHHRCQIAVQVYHLLLLMRIGQRPAETARFHALLNEFHIAEILHQYRTPVFRCRLGIDPFALGLLTFGKAFERLAFKNALVRIIAIGAHAVA